MPRPVTGSVSPSGSGSASRLRLTASAPATAAISSPGIDRILQAGVRAGAQQRRPAPSRGAAPLSTITGRDRAARARRSSAASTAAAGSARTTTTTSGGGPSASAGSRALGLVALRAERADKRLVAALGDDENAASIHGGAVSNPQPGVRPLLGGFRA